MKTYWISFARRGENYVVVEDAEDHKGAVEKAMPLKNFNPQDWSMECYEVPHDSTEVKDFEKHKLITEADLRAKGYLKPSEMKNRN